MKNWPQRAGGEWGQGLCRNSYIEIRTHHLTILQLVSVGGRRNRPKLKLVYLVRKRLEIVALTTTKPKQNQLD